MVLGCCLNIKNIYCYTNLSWFVFNVDYCYSDQLMYSLCRYLWRSIDADPNEFCFIFLNCNGFWLGIVTCGDLSLLLSVYGVQINLLTVFHLLSIEVWLQNLNIVILTSVLLDLDLQLHFKLRGVVIDSHFCVKLYTTWSGILFEDCKTFSMAGVVFFLHHE